MNCSVSITIHYEELFLNKYKNDDNDRASYFNDFKKMNRLNNNYESLDYYWEVIIEEL